MMGGGADFMGGGFGNDFMSGGMGADMMQGGFGNDMTCPAVWCATSWGRLWQ